jgi:diaminopimelate epimerase
MEGAGNDFVMLFRDSDSDVDVVRPRIPSLCDRRTGIGADGVIFVMPADTGDFRMRIFNADGSEAEMCGNGMRCLVKYVEQEGLTEKRALKIETRAGTIATERLNGLVRVTMGAPVLEARDVPTTQASGRAIDVPLTVGGRTFAVTAVSMGNPHAVVFTDEITDDMVLDYGAQLERHPFFPNRANVEFVRVLSPVEAQMRVWERGCGETMACGTGACACVVAGICTNRFKPYTTVHLPGGDLVVEWDGDLSHPVFLTGPARCVFEGNLQADGPDE